MKVCLDDERATHEDGDEFNGQLGRSISRKLGESRRAAWITTKLMLNGELAAMRYSRAIHAA
ncbi:hypothetical protein EC9_32580 [Rosistilla ulvae]|uniref:Uncharacterized protein n=1 Tax=Rosistilla ulvae TaxID=1930277 RepID=A0A517M2G5_9BACT|nr:hypothetical protein EC9_32580 [Rosistilla ulvae]